MAVRKPAQSKTAVKKQTKNAKAAASPLFADGTYVSAVILDVEPLVSSNGAKGTHILFEVVKPRLYAGRQVHFRVYETMEKTLDNLSEQFPEADFLDAESVWTHLGSGGVHRARIGLDEAHEYEGKSYEARNRVTSIYSTDKKLAEPVSEGEDIPF